jgi:hypothetical protein
MFLLVVPASGLAATAGVGMLLLLLLLLLLLFFCTVQISSHHCPPPKPPTSAPPLSRLTPGPVAATAAVARNLASALSPWEGIACIFVVLPAKSPIAMQLLP